MKKFFAIIILILGIIILISGLGLFVYSKFFSQNNIILASLVTSFLGIILIIIGIVMLSTKTKSQKSKEIELKILKDNQKKIDEKNNLTSSKETFENKEDTGVKHENLNQSGDVIEKLEKLVKLKEQGILTENEFIDQKNKLLNNL